MAEMVVFNLLLMVTVELRVLFVNFEVSLSVMFILWAYCSLFFMTNAAVFSARRMMTSGFSCSYLVVRMRFFFIFLFWMYPWDLLASARKGWLNIRCGGDFSGLFELIYIVEEDFFFDSLSM